ncbi:hypothetical protein NUSPORA_02352 [Nucleospora cyclopteri]
MIIKILFLMNLVFCMDYFNNIIIHNNKINSIICDNNFLEYFCPKTYNYEQSYTCEDVMNHLKDIVFKTIDKTFLSAAINEKKFNKRLLSKYLLRIEIIAKNFRIIFSKSYDIIVIYFQLEIMFFEFFFNTLQFIIQLEDKKEISEKVIYNLLFKNLQKVLNKIKNRKYIFRKSNKSNSVDDNQVITFLNKISSFIRNQKNIIQTKFYLNAMLTKSISQYIENYKIQNEDNQHLFITKKQIDLIDNKNRYAKKCISKLISILTHPFNVCTENLSVKIEKKIDEIYIIIDKIIKTDSFLLDTKYFFMILYYFDYLKKQIYIDFYRLEKSFKEESEIFYSTESLQSDSIFFRLNNEKKKLSGVYCDFSLKYFNYYKHNVICEKNRIINKIFYDFIRIERLYDDVLTFRICNNKKVKPIKQQHHHYKNNKEILILIQKIKTYKGWHELIRTNFICFQARCISILRMCSAYLFLYNNYKVLTKKHIIDAISTHIQTLSDVLDNLKINEPLNIKKIEFIKFLIDKNKSNLSLINIDNTSINSETLILETKFCMHKEMIFDLKYYNLVFNIYLSTNIFLDRQFLIENVNSKNIKNDVTFSKPISNTYKQKQPNLNDSKIYAEFQLINYLENNPNNCDDTIIETLYKDIFDEEI